MLNIILSILPGILVCILFYFLDKDRKKLNILLLILTFIFGAISSYLCYRLEWHFGSFFKEIENCNLFEVFFYAIFGVAIFEEGFKLLFSFIFTRLDKVKSLFSTIVYCIFAGSGFMTFENLFFFSLKYGLDTTISRMFTSIPSHICFAIFMGLLLYKCKDYKLKSLLYLFLALLVPTLLHAFYNTFLYQGIESLYIYNKIYLMILTIISIYIVIRIRFFNNNNKT